MRHETPIVNVESAELLEVVGEREGEAVFESFLVDRVAGRQRLARDMHDVSMRECAQDERTVKEIRRLLVREARPVAALRTRQGEVFSGNGFRIEKSDPRGVFAPVARQTLRRTFEGAADRL